MWARPGQHGDQIRPSYGADQANMETRTDHHDARFGPKKLRTDPACIETKTGLHGGLNRYIYGVETLLSREQIRFTVHGGQIHSSSWNADTAFMEVRYDLHLGHIQSPKSNANFRDITQNVLKNKILHEIFRILSRFAHYISCYFSENRLPLAQCTAVTITRDFGKGS